LQVNHEEILLKPHPNVISHSSIPSTPDNRQPIVETPPDLAPLTRLIASGLNNIEQCLQQLLQLHAAQEKPINATEKLIMQNSIQRSEKGHQKPQRRKGKFALNTYKENPVWWYFRVSH
jgi:hypothetical protein